MHELTEITSVRVPRRPDCDAGRIGDPRRDVRASPHTRVSADGTTETIAEIPGGPNGGITVISLHLNFV